MQFKFRNGADLFYVASRHLFVELYIWDFLLEKFFSSAWWFVKIGRGQIYSATCFLCHSLVHLSGADACLFKGVSLVHPSTLRFYFLIFEFGILSDTKSNKNVSFLRANCYFYSYWHQMLYTNAFVLCTLIYFIKYIQ